MSDREELPRVRYVLERVGRRVKLAVPSTGELFEADDEAVAKAELHAACQKRYGVGRYRLVKG